MSVLIAPTDPPPTGMQVVPLMAIQANESPYTFQPDFGEWVGQMLELRLTFGDIYMHEMDPWFALSLRTRGPVVPFKFAIPKPNRGPGGGTPQVDGNQAALARILKTKGWTPNTLVLRRGDFVQTGADATARVHVVDSDVTSDATGLADLPIWPYPRRAMSNNEAVIASGVAGMFRFSQALQPAFDGNVARNVAFTIREAI